jgi:hypothetical protein
MTPKPIEQHVSSFGRPGALARPKTTEGGDCGKRHNEGDDNNKVNQRQNPAHARLQSETHRGGKDSPPSLTVTKKIDIGSAARFPLEGSGLRNPIIGS